MEEGPEPHEGLRARKRRETRRRIAEEGLKLFVEHGYDGTTLDAVAAAAGVSPRTLFHHFKTKDEVLQFWKGEGFMDMLAPTLLAQPKDLGPLEVVRRTFMAMIGRYETEKSVVVDRILNSTEALRTRKQAWFVELERIVFDLLCQMWPDPACRPRLRMTAMAALGAMRLAMEARREDPSDRSLVDHLADSFGLLKAV